MFSKLKKGGVRVSTLATTCSVDDLPYLEDIERRRLKLYGPILPTDTFASFSAGISTCADCARHILEYNEEDYGLPIEERSPIWLLIDSPGGDPTAGFHLIDTITLSNTPVITVNVGQCSSMAFLIMISGHGRFSYPSATFLMHDGSIFVNGTTNKVRDLMHFEDKMESDIIKPHVLKHSNMTSEKYDEVCSKEYYMTAKEALAEGFIEGIVDSLELFMGKLSVRVNRND